MADRSKYKVGDLMISHPTKHIGVVIDVEKDFYKTNFGRMNRITIRCETMGFRKVFYLPETAVDVAFGGEPGWVKVNDP